MQNFIPAAAWMLACGDALIMAASTLLLDFNTNLSE